MKKSFVLSFLCLMILYGFISCENASFSQNNENEKEATGKISGKVTYSNLEESNYGGIIVTLDKTDGLRTIAVNKAVVSRSVENTARSLLGTVTTSKDGSYAFENIEPGTYTVYAASSYSKEKAVCTNVVVRSAEETIAEVLKLTATGSISGRITLDNKTSGNSGFLVFVAGTSYMAMTDDAGNYTISDVPAGSGYQVLATKNSVIHILSSNVTVTANGSSAMPNDTFTSDELKNIDGKDGSDGVSIVWLGVFDSESEIKEPKYLNAYFNKTDGCSYIYDGMKWTLLARSGANGSNGNNGTNGTNGTNGLSIVWKGELSSAPENPEVNWAYYNTETGCSYIWNGAKWDLLSKAGIDGTNGTNGLSIVWKGELSSAPENPEVNWAYYNTETGCSYIWNGEKWDLLARAGANGADGGNLSGALAIGTVLSTEELTNENITISVYITKTDLLKIGYVYSPSKVNWKNAKDVLDDSNFVDIVKSVDGKYKITASENGYYTIAVKDADGYLTYTEECISNIDNSAPEAAVSLNAKYNISSKTITVTWINPDDNDFDYVSLSYTKGGTVLVSNVQIKNGIYSIENVEIDGDEYVFTLFSVDKVGNKSTSISTNVTPIDGVKVQSISLSRYHLAYNDSNQSLTAIALLSNADLIEEGTVIKIQVKDSDGNVTNKVAEVDKEAGTATAIITAPTTISNNNGSTYTVLCKIGDDSADTVHTARFNVSSPASLNRLSQSLNGSSYSENKLQIPLSSVTASVSEIVRIQGYNLDLASPAIQFYDSTGRAYFTEPITVDTSTVKWTATSGENYQTIDTKINIPDEDDTYTIRILLDGVIQNDYSKQLQVYDVPKFTSFDIPLVSVMKEDNIVNAKITGKNFDTPDVDLSDFTATCSSKMSIVANTSFTRNSDSVIYATFTIPGTVGEYDITVNYGDNSVTGVLKVQDFACSVGDVLLSDGTIVAYDSSNLTFTDEQKEKAVGIIYGNRYGIPEGYLGIYNSAGGKNSGCYQWAASSTIGYNTMLTDIICTPSVTHSSKSADNAVFTGDIDGSDNWEYICSIDPEGTRNAEYNYPAFNYANNYASTFGLGEKYAKGWYIPSVSELCSIYKNIDLLNSVIEALGGVKFQRRRYWSSSQSGKNYFDIWSVDFSGSIQDPDKPESEYVCCVHNYQ